MTLSRAPGDGALGSQVPPTCPSLDPCLPPYPPDHDQDQALWPLLVEVRLLLTLAPTVCQLLRVLGAREETRNCWCQPFPGAPFLLILGIINRLILNLLLLLEH